MNKIFFRLLIAQGALFSVFPASPLVAVFYCMSATAEQSATLMVWSAFIFFAFLVIQVIGVWWLYRSVSATMSVVASAASCSDAELISVAKKNSALPLYLSILYGISIFLASLMVHAVYRFYDMGPISAASGWGGTIAGLLACPFMVLGATSLILSGNTELIADALRRRALHAETVQIRIFPKLLSCFIGIAIGLVVWLGFAAFYTGINQTIEEIKFGDSHLLKAMSLELEKAPGTENRVSLFKTIAAYYPSRRLFVADPAGGLKFITHQDDLTIGRWKGLADALSTGLASGKSGNLYDNVNERVISWMPVGQNQDLMIGSLSYLKTRLSRYTVFFVWTAIFILVGLVVATVLGITNVLSISRSIDRAAAVLHDLAAGEGDLKTRLAVTSSDEVGDLARRFNIFTDKLLLIVQSIVEKANGIQLSSNRFSDLSLQMSTGIGDLQKETTNMLDIVASNSNELGEVAAKCNETNTNVNHVAAAAEQMATSVAEVAKRSEEARQTTENAVQTATNTSEKISELGTAAKNINKVTEAITEISEQINLLALNATIEAARAGEAGKGFAVVANEIKTLARQTAEATDEIKERINGIQVSTEESVHGMDVISRVIQSISEFVYSIAGAVEEQSQTTREIASNIAQVSNGVTHVNDNVAESAQSSQSIFSRMEKFHAKADDISENSIQVDAGARELLAISEQLSQQLAKFKF